MNLPSNNLPVWRDFLGFLVKELKGRGGAIWLVDQQEARLEATEGLVPSDFFSSTESSQSHQLVLRDVLQRRQSRATPVVPTNGLSAAGPMVILTSPITQSGRLLGAVEIVLPQQTPPSPPNGQLHFLERACCLPEPIALEPKPPAAAVPIVLTSPVSVETAPAQPRAAVDWPAVMEWLKHLQNSLRLHEVAGAICNEGRLVWHVDRVSVVVPQGRSVKVIAVSGQDKVHHRSNLIQALKRLAKLVMDTREPFRYGGSAEDIAPSLERPLAEFTQLGGARFVLIVPLLEPRREEPPAGIDPIAEPPRKVLGAVVIEQMQHSQPAAELVAHMDLVRENLAAAVRQAVFHETIFLLPVWTGLGRFRNWLRGRRLAWAALIVAGVVATTLAMFFVPWEFRIDAKGKLMPVVQRDVFAPRDGQVVKLFAASGQRVSEDKLLLTLENDELQAEFVKTQSEHREKREQFAAYNSQHIDAEKAGDRNEAERLVGKIEETRQEIEGLKQRLVLLQKQRDLLEVRSPIHGVITTFQPEQRLLQRPVERGELLLEVMDDHGAWRLELEVPEHRLGHILAAQQAENDKLPITFRMLTRPEASYSARLVEVGSRSVTSEEQGSVVELIAEIDASALDSKSIGAEVRARIGCGRKPLGYCLFGDVIEFVQKYLWW